MFHLLRLVIAVAGVVVAGSTAAAADDDSRRTAAGSCASLPRPAMSVRLTVPPGQDPGIAPLIRQIVDDTWRSEGLDFTWHLGSPSERAWEGMDLWIAVVEGPQANGVMGSVVFGGGIPHRLIRIFLEPVTDWVRRDEAARHRLDVRLFDSGLGETSVLVPRALGLIAAHEVGHVILADAGHARDGVMQARYAGAMRILKAPGLLPLDNGSRSRLRQRLADGAQCR